MTRRTSLAAALVVVSMSALILVAERQVAPGPGRHPPAGPVGLWRDQASEAGAVPEGGSTRPGAIQTMRNPAAVYCSQLGYGFAIVDEPDGAQRGVCTLPGGQACDAWDFLSGTCGPEFSICARQGLRTVVLEDGQNPFSKRYAACADESGKIIRRVTDELDLVPQSVQVPLLPGNPASGEAAAEDGSNDVAPADAADLPTSFDWRSESGSDWTSPVKSQGQCGSCWAFSAVGVTEAALNIAYGNPDLDPNLSEQYLVTDCAADAGSCKGGSDGEALAYIRDYGIPDEACLPYHDGDPDGCTFDASGCDADLCTYHVDPECSDYRCGDRCDDWSSRLNTIETRGWLYYPSRTTMKDYLIAYGPLAVAMNMNGGWHGDDIYDCTSTSRNHAVSIVGYDDAGGYWIVKNSWGSTWGPDNDGFFKVAYGNCGIEFHAYYVDAEAGAEVGPLTYYGRTVDDDDSGQSSGNDNGIVECGEAIELYVDLYNQGDSAATDVTAAITTTDPYITFVQNTSSGYPDVPAGTSRANSDDFDFQVAPTAPDGHVVHFDLDITASNGGPWSDGFDLPVSCGTVEGLAVSVANQSGLPAVDAYVQVYSDTGQSADYAGYTDSSGTVAFPQVPPGTYTVVVNSSVDHFLLLEEDVEAPAALSLDTSGTAEVDVTTYGLDGSTPVQAGLLFAPFYRARPDVGWTDAGGYLQVNVTPYTYTVIAASFDDPYLLAKPGLVLSGPSAVSFDPTAMAKGEITPDLLDFATLRLGSWGSHSAWSWNFTLSDGEAMTFSPDTYNLDPDLIKSGDQIEWYYTLDGAYGSYQVVAGSSAVLLAGGEFGICTMPDQSFYQAGDVVAIDSCFTDAWGNRIVWIEQYTASSPDPPLSQIEVQSAVRRPPPLGDGTEPQRASPLGLQDWSSTCPAVVAVDADDQVIVEDLSCAHWTEDYVFPLSTGAAQGVYTATVSVDTGPHQGLLASQVHFVVGSVAGDIDGDGIVGANDVQDVAARWRTTCDEPDPDGDPGTPGYDPLCDVDKDGQITVVDMMGVVAHWGEGGP